MAIPNIPDTDSFDVWRQKCNLIANIEGDLVDLVTVDKTSLVAAINETVGLVEEGNRGILIRAIALA